MNVSELLDYLFEHDTSHDLGIALAEIYAQRTHPKRRRRVTRDARAGDEVTSTPSEPPVASSSSKRAARTWR